MLVVAVAVVVVVVEVERAAVSMMPSPGEASRYCPSAPVQALAGVGEGRRTDGHHHRRHH